MGRLEAFVSSTSLDRRRPFCQQRNPLVDWWVGSEIGDLEDIRATVSVFWWVGGLTREGRLGHGKWGWVPSYSSFPKYGPEERKLNPSSCSLSIVCFIGSLINVGQLIHVALLLAAWKRQCWGRGQKCPSFASPEGSGEEPVWINGCIRYRICQPCCALLFSLSFFSFQGKRWRRFLKKLLPAWQFPNFPVFHSTSASEGGGLGLPLPQAGPQDSLRSASTSWVHTAHGTQH